MATASADDTVIVWNVSDPARPQAVTTLTNHKKPVHCVAFSPNGTIMATGSADHTVIVWRLDHANSTA
jgi:WD40 repeat protein